MTDAVAHTLMKPQFSMTGRMVTMSPGEDGLIGIPFPEHSSELLSRLNAQRRAGLLCDLTLTSRGTHYPTHRSVMAAVSLYFRRLFGAEEGVGEGVGGGCSVCQLDCVSPDALDALLEFAYTATLTIRSSGMREVLEGAQLLGIQCVADACRHILGEAGEEDGKAVDGAPRGTSSRRKQNRRNVAKATSVVRPAAWGEGRREAGIVSRSAHPQMSNQHSTPEEEEEEEEQCLPPNAGHNGAVSGVLTNGNKSWPDAETPTLVLRLPNESPLEEEDSKAEGAFQAHAPLPIEPVVAMGGRADTGGIGVKKRKSQTPQQCPVCQKIIHGAGKLPRHMRTHTGEKPFQCTACGVRFTRNDKLKIHMRKHTGERPYPCPSCPARFLHSYDLKNHLSLHSGDRPYECPLCHKAFAREDHLQRHRKGHSCLELRTRRPRRGNEPSPSPPAETPLPPQCGATPHQHSPSSSTAAPVLFPRCHDTSSTALMGSEVIRYPGLLWRAVEGLRGPNVEGRERPPQRAPSSWPEWGEEEEEEEEEEGHEEDRERVES